MISIHVVCVVFDFSHKFYVLNPILTNIRFLKVQVEYVNLSRYQPVVMGKKSKKKRQDNLSHSVGEVSDNVLRMISENVETAESGNISTFLMNSPTSSMRCKVRW